MTINHNGGPMERTHYQTLADHDLRYWWFATRHDTVLRWLKLGRGFSGLLLDVGCGAGGFLRRCIDHGTPESALLGLDIDAPSVQIATDRGVPAMVMPESGLDAGALPQQPNAITMLDVLEHVDDPVAMLRSLHDIACDNCTLVVLVPAHAWLWSAWDDRLGHRRRYTRRVLHAQLEAAGWTVTHQRHLFPSMVLPGLLRARMLKAETLPADEFPRVPKWLNTLLHRWTSIMARVPVWPVGSSLGAIAVKRSGHTH
jgi:SAM-dependent methyltransferase